MQRSFSNPKYPMVLVEPFLMWQLKTVSLYYLRWVFDRCMRKWKVSQWEETPVWAALHLWQRTHRYYGRSESSSSVVLHSEVNQSISYVLLFQILLIITEGVFLNVNFPKITRNRPAECHGPFPPPCLHLVWSAVKPETSFVHPSPMPSSCLHAKRCLNTLIEWVSDVREWVG